MRYLNAAVGIGLFVSCCHAYATTVVKYENGWWGFVKQVDPFDTSKVKTTQIWKGNFTFRCGELSVNISHSDSDYDSYSYDRNIKYIVDEASTMNKTGTLSTYLGGSDLMTSSVYLSFKLSDEDIDMLKKGDVIKVAGETWGGWVTDSLNLSGFNSTYSKMCNP